MQRTRFRVLGRVEREEEVWRQMRRESVLNRARSAVFLVTEWLGSDEEVKETGGREKELESRNHAAAASCGSASISGLANMAPSAGWMQSFSTKAVAVVCEQWRRRFHDIFAQQQERCTTLPCWNCSCVREKRRRSSRGSVCHPLFSFLPYIAPCIQTYFPVYPSSYGCNECSTENLFCTLASSLPTQAPQITVFLASRLFNKRRESWYKTSLGFCDCRLQSPPNSATFWFVFRASRLWKLLEDPIIILRDWSNDEEDYWKSTVWSICRLSTKWSRILLRWVPSKVRFLHA